MILTFVVKRKWSIFHNVFRKAQIRPYPISYKLALIIGNWNFLFNGDVI